MNMRVTGPSSAEVIVVVARSAGVGSQRVAHELHLPNSKRLVHETLGYKTDRGGVHEACAAACVRQAAGESGVVLIKALKRPIWEIPPRDGRLDVALHRTNGC